jgi:membrane fusion protein, multidrug efflux system
MQTLPSIDKPEWALTAGDRRRIERERQGKKRRRWPVVVVLGLLSVGGFTAWQMAVPATEPDPATVEAEQTPSEPVLRLASVDVTTLEPQTLERRVAVTGTLRPLRHADLTAQVSGIVREVNFRPGDVVREGDVMVQLDTRDLQLSLDQARANMAATQAQLALAEQQLSSTRALAERELTSANNLATAESTVSSTRAQLAALQTQVDAAEVALGKATIRAPFDGTVSARTVEPNQSIAAGAQLISVVDLSRIEVEAAAPLGQATNLAPGQTVELTVESLQNRLFSGTVDRINPVAIEGTRSISLFATLDNPDGFLRGGMFVTGHVITASKDDAIAVPAAAIQEDDEGTYVLAVRNGEIVRQPVELGEVWGTNGTTEITGGLEAGDTVVNTTLERLLPGAKVAVAEVK